MRKFFIDTEFIEAGPYNPLQLISLAIVAETGETYYTVCSEFDPATANQWVQDNVLAKLEPESQIPRKTRAQIAVEVQSFVDGCLINHLEYTNGQYAKGSPKFYGYYSAYDWVVFAQVFGTMMDLPKGWPMFCRDLIQMAKEEQDRIGVDVVGMVGQPAGEHNALADAQWNKSLHDALMVFRGLQKIS